MAGVIVQSGFAKIVLKADEEPAMLDCKRDTIWLAREEIAVDIVPEGSQVAATSQNGRHDRAGHPGGRGEDPHVEVLGGAVAQDEARGEPPADDLHGRAPCEFAGQIISRAHRYPDIGRTAYELRKGKPYVQEEVARLR